MKVLIKRSKINGLLTATSSKSEFHRALICSALTLGKSVIKYGSLNNDVTVTINALKKLGVKIKVAKHRLTVDSRLLFRRVTATTVLNCADSGTSARFLIALSSLTDKKITIDGGAGLRLRPMKALLDALSLQGTQITVLHADNHLPLSVKGGSLSGGKLIVNSQHTSQYVSALLLISPFAQKETVLIIKNGRSLPYINLTKEVMNKFGISVKKTKNGYSVPSGQKYIPARFTVSGDYSQAAFLFAAAALTGGRVTVKNLDKNSSQGDKYFLDILKQMGCLITVKNNRVTLENNSSLKGISLDMGNYPDLVPPLTVLAGNCRGVIKIRNIGHLKDKESDRLETLSLNLKKMGITVKKYSNRFTVFPGILTGALISSFNDHRIAMIFAVAALHAKGSSVINNAVVVNKSYPGFWKDLQKVGTKISYIN